ncbi:MAG: CRISPR-associated RAMP protein [Thermoflexales bacterium]|nr:CRISPR-associated RAMP protein [Thermoflexales bacterium]
MTTLLCFSSFINRTIIKATLEMETALAVGSRLSLEPTGTDMPVLKDPNGRPFIPGSSIKGVVRFQAERILRTWNRPPHFWACDPFGEPCVPEKSRDGRKGKEELWEESKPSDAVFAQMVFEASCTACRLFGSPWFAGRVAFKDACLTNADVLPIVTQIRDGVGIDRDLGAARTGVKYDFETVVPGARFGLEILAENLEDWELGFLLTVLRFWEEGGIAIGGKTTRGPGWGRLKDLTVQQVGAENLLDYLQTRQMATREVGSLIQAFQEWLKKQEAGHA